MLVEVAVITAGAVCGRAVAGATGVRAVRAADPRIADIGPSRALKITQPIILIRMSGVTSLIAHVVDCHHGVGLTLSAERGVYAQGTGLGALGAQAGC